MNALATMPPSALAETAVSAVATQAMASVQARYVMAERRPRSLDQVRVALLKQCKEPTFARVAMYHKPIGEGISGPSIRFAEAALRCMTNVLIESPTIYDDESKRIVRVVVTDLEANATYQKDVTVTKEVERNYLKKGQEPLRARVGSKGQTVYVVRATDDEILNKEGALISKAVRTLGLRLIPGELIDEALYTVEQTLAQGSAQSPDAERRRLVDAFTAIGVYPADLVEYLRCGLEKISPAQLATLRKIYQTIRDGEASWADYLDEQASTEEDAPKKSKTSRTKEALKNRRKAEQTETPVYDQQQGEEQ